MLVNFCSPININLLNKIPINDNIRPSVNNKCPGFFSDFTGKLRAQKPNKAQTKRGIQYFRGLWSFLRAHQQEWCQLRLIVFILYSLHFLTICANFPFFLRHHNQQSAPPPTKTLNLTLTLTALNHLDLTLPLAPYIPAT